MTTTNAANATKRVAPPALSAATSGDMNAHSLVQVYFRQSADGVNFTVTPVLMHPADAQSAVNRFKDQYSLDGVTYAAWASGNTSAQPVGGRGRLLGASLPSD